MTAFTSSTAEVWLHQHGITRLETSCTILDGGGASLIRLGSLGHDLGEIVAVGGTAYGVARVATGPGNCERLVDAEGIAIDLYTGDYATDRAEMLDAESALHRFAPSIVVTP